MGEIKNKISETILKNKIKLIKETILRLCSSACDIEDRLWRHTPESSRNE
jgi:hypothetical protein